MAKVFETNKYKAASFIDDVLCLKEKLMGWAKMYCEQGYEAIDAQELGEVVDMIKDLAEAHKCCEEALYYESVTNAMDEAGDEMRYGEVRGYNPNRSSRTGRYMRETSSGHMPMDEMWPEMMGYTMGNSNSGRSGNSGAGSSGNSGYSPNYEMYRDAKRHYRTSKDAGSKSEMDAYASQHIGDTIETIRDIWNDADPAFRKRMKEDLTALIDQMKV